MEYQRLEELVNQNKWDEACRELDKYVEEIEKLILKKK